MGSPCCVCVCGGSVQATDPSVSQVLEQWSRPQQQSDTFGTSVILWSSKSCSSFGSKNGIPLNLIIWSAIPPNPIPHLSLMILVTPTTIMVGIMYRFAPVSSNIITTTVNVKCVIPLSAAAAPKKAYVPDIVQVPSFAPVHGLSVSTSKPTARPNVAPAAMDGTNIPHGTLQPYEITTRKTLNNVA
ncbi:hypothetical protein OGAPHI_002813 [Ogataea philodendri]|uniref:Uncharacterized protein n=1 Tax=Ogataea philodendri TaxID=1378263 RepID=A0A9P8P924_9ASCO|nr:uncharacterized protein OGAPHI_002813 [Ogataea philodendri]KAH3667164.1 hypothetical protein OGAPHI_002813 [Ogataea philodendri]